MKSLYSLIAGVIIFFSISTSDSYAWYRLTAKNGGPNGYANQVVHWDYWGTDIRCEYAGSSKCSTEAKRETGFLFRSDAIDRKDQEGANYAFNQMRKGVKEGKIKMPSGRLVEWKRTDTDIYVYVR